MNGHVAANNYMITRSGSRACSSSTAAPVKSFGVTDRRDSSRFWIIAESITGRPAGASGGDASGGPVTVGGKSGVSSDAGRPPAAGALSFDLSVACGL